MRNSLVFVAGVLVATPLAVQARAPALVRTGPPPQSADLVLRNGRIVTLDDKVPEGQALAIRAAASGGRATPDIKA